MDDTELVRQISAHCRTSPDERVLRRVLSILQRARGGGGAVDEGRRRSEPLNAAMATGGGASPARDRSLHVGRLQPPEARWRCGGCRDRHTARSLPLTVSSVLIRGMQGCGGSA